MINRTFVSVVSGVHNTECTDNVSTVISQAQNVEGKYENWRRYIHKMRDHFYLVRKTHTQNETR